MASETNFKRNFVIDHVQGRLVDYYDVETKKLGEGTYGTVSKAVNKSTQAVRAVKSIQKKDVKNTERFKLEIELMKKLDHPNILRLFETFGDHKFIYLVLELCSGGELFDRVLDEGSFTEKSAANLMKQILAAIYYLHRNNILHRDLKPENFLFSTKAADSPLKCIDFGLATTFTEGQRLHTKAGTPYYVSPQVLKGDYDRKCDVWSCGVIMYIIMCGYPPFYGDNDSEILHRVRHGVFDFPEDDWSEISLDAKDLISQLLLTDEKKRPEAEGALGHRWVQTQAASASSKPLATGLTERFKAFRATGRMKKIALTAIAQQLPESQIEQLKETFLALDANGDGCLTLKELQEAVQKNNIVLPPDFEDTFRALDSDGSGSIDYSEFLAATIDKRVYIQESVCWSAFRIFDTNGDGKISKEELARALGDSGEDISSILGKKLNEVEQILAEVDKDGDGHLDFDEFMAMMRG